MVSACKSYITDNDMYRVWDVEPQVLVNRFDDCTKLYKHYQDCFQQAKDRADKSKRHFEVSEMYVFGKFSSFCRRLKQIGDIVELMRQFSVLKHSRIEGIDVYATRFSHIISSIKKKVYNPLDHRKMEFVSDYEDFQRQISELEDTLVAFMTTTFSQVQSTLQSLKLIRRYMYMYCCCLLLLFIVVVIGRFHSMNLNCLRDPIKDKLADIVTDFHKDIEGAQNVIIIN